MLSLPRSTRDSGSTRGQKHRRKFYAAVGSSVAFKLPAITQDAFWGEMNVKVWGISAASRQVAPHMVRAAGAGSSTSAAWPRAHDLDHRERAQRRGRRADQEHGRRARPARDQRDRGPSRRHADRAVRRELVDDAASDGDDPRRSPAQRYANNSCGRRSSRSTLRTWWPFWRRPNRVPIKGDVIGVGGRLPREISLLRRGPILRRMDGVPTQLGHVALRVRDLDRAVDVLSRRDGPQAEAPSTRRSRFWVFARTPRTRSPCSPCPPTRPAPSRTASACTTWPGRWRSFEDLEQFHARLLANHAADHRLQRPPDERHVPGPGRQRARGASGSQAMPRMARATPRPGRMPGRASSTEHYLAAAIASWYSLRI